MKTISLLKYENGFVNPIKIIPGPNGGAYIEQEIKLMVPEEEHDEIEVVIYEIKEVNTVKLKDL